MCGNGGLSSLCLTGKHPSNNGQRLPSLLWSLQFVPITPSFLNCVTHFRAALPRCVSLAIENHLQVYDIWWSTLIEFYSHASPVFALLGITTSLTTQKSYGCICFSASCFELTVCAHVACWVLLLLLVAYLQLPASCSIPEAHHRLHWFYVTCVGTHRDGTV